MLKCSRGRFEEALNSLAKGLSLKGRLKRYDLVQRKVGRLIEQFAPVGSHYDVEVIADAKQKIALDLTWKKNKT